jgi:hypothetical protein
LKHAHAVTTNPKKPAMKKAVLIDASSAILLFKTNWMAPLLDHYQVGVGPTVYREVTVPRRPGAEAFARWRQEQRLVLHTLNGTTANPPAGRSNRLDPGERECLALYAEGAGKFIIVDDGPAAAFCRRRDIPYVNALLVPRLLVPRPVRDREGLKDAVLAIYAEGRYASWVLEYALTCPDEDLAFFLP